MREILKISVSRTHGGLELARDYLKSRFAGGDDDAFEGVRTYCMFVGYPKSGHSLIGSLLDAHPDMVIAHELDALRYLRAGFGREQLYRLIRENARRFSEAGREWNNYSYEVPGQWQGRVRDLQVIGDKKGGHSTLCLDAHPELLQKLRKTVGVPVKFVYVVRNPYDNISTISREGLFNPKHDGSRDLLRCAIENYFDRARAMRDFLRRVEVSDVHEMRHEAFVENPGRHVRELCGFLGLDAPEDYLRACASVVSESPTRSRQRVEWDEASIEDVRRRIGGFEFLRGYSYED